MDITTQEAIKLVTGLKQEKVTQEQMGMALGVTKQNISQTKNKVLSQEQIDKIEQFFNVSLTNVKSPVSCDRIEINYWPELPDRFKNPQIHSVWFDREIIENQWHVSPDKLCIIPMFGDALSEFWYKINDNDLLIIDTEQNEVFEPAVYFATSKENTRYWVREIDILANENIEFHRYTSGGQITKKYTREELKAVDFRIIGRVIKNVSFRI